jgi:hypothetical protein
MADVERHTEDWAALPWKEFQRNVHRLQKRIYQATRRGDATLRFAAEDILEVHHQDGNRNNNRFTNLVLLHGHCHDRVHGKWCL